MRKKERKKEKAKIPVILDYDITKIIVMTHGWKLPHWVLLEKTLI